MWTQLEELLQKGRKLAVQLRLDTRETERITITWIEVAFRNKSREAERLLGDRAHDCLDFELAASDLLEPASDADGRSRTVHTPSHSERAALDDQRNLLRTLLAALTAAVSQIRERCESRFTNGINLFIIILTISSLVVAIVTLGVAKITYDDAKDSGEQERKAMETEIASLNRASDALGNLALAEKVQERILRNVSTNARKQTEYLGTEEARLREQNRTRQLQAGAGEIFDLTQDLLKYFAVLDSWMNKCDEMARPLMIKHVMLMTMDQKCATYYHSLLAREEFIVGKIGAWSREIQETGKSTDFNALMKANPFTQIALVKDAVLGPGVVTLRSSENALVRLQETMESESTKKEGPDLGAIAVVMEHMIRNDFHTYTGIYMSYLQTAERACDKLSPHNPDDTAILELAAQAFELPPPTNNEHADYMREVSTVEARKNGEFEIATSNIMEAWVRLVYVYKKSILKWPD